VLYVYTYFWLRPIRIKLDKILVHTCLEICLLNKSMPPLGIFVAYWLHLSFSSRYIEDWFFFKRAFTFLKLYFPYCFFCTIIKQKPKSTYLLFLVKSANQLMRGEWPVRWEPQEEGVMSIAASFPSVKKPRFNIIQEKSRQQRLKVMLASLWQLQTIYMWCLVQALLASCNVEPAHNTTKYFAPNLRWGCQSHRLLETKVMSISSGKQ
jgi:hypothetical protein